MRSRLQSVRPSVEGGSGHAEVACDLCGRLAALDKAEGVADLAVSDPSGPAAEVFAGLAALGDRVGDAFAFDLVLHLRERCHDRKQHRTHRRGGVDVASPQVEDPKPCAPGSQFVGEGEHVLGGSSEPVQGCDHEDVAVSQRVECSVELLAGSRAPETP